MGGGGQHNDDRHAAIPPSPSRPFRQHRRRAQPVHAESNGLDQPPSVVCPSLGNQPCSLNIRTTQHLCTLVHPPSNEREENIPAGAAPCDPVVAFGRYVVSATNDGRVCFFSVRQQQDPCRPVTVVEVDPRTTVTGLVATPAGVSLVRYRSIINKERLLQPPGFLGHIVTISPEGDVHILECSNNGQVKKLFSWKTGLCNVSCVTLRPDRTGQWRISLGYESGTLEEWLVSISVREAIKTASVDDDGESQVGEESKDATTNEPEWKPLMRRVFPQLIFRGFFDLPIRSVSSLGIDATGESCLNSLVEDTKDNSNTVTVGQLEDKFSAHPNLTEECKEGQTEAATSETNEEADDNKTEPKLVSNDTRDYLSVCLVMNPRTSDDSLGRPASSSQIDVLKIHSLERDWATMLEQEEEHVSSKGTKDLALPLDEYCVWPDVGMEILDTASLPAHEHSDGQRRLSRSIRGLPSQGSDRICAYHGTGRPFFAAALSDGTIARLRATFQDDVLRWGVHHDSEQVVLSYPAIGIALVSLSTSTTSVACCLRGGTVYLLPESEHLEPITVILGPVDTDGDSSINHLQGFTAGNVCVDGIPGIVANELAVLIFASAGGIMKVSTCALLAQSEEDLFLQELVKNGSAQLLRELLCSVDEDDKLLMTSQVWRKAREELAQAPYELKVEMLNSSSFINTRQLLFEIAEEDRSNN